MPLDATLAAPSAALLSPSTPTLADAAFARLRGFFQTAGHIPSQSQWAALRDLLDHLGQAADGLLPPSIYLSGIPAGGGKTRSVVAFAEALVSEPRYAAVGMLICVHRIEEARDLAEALAPHRNNLCVITSRPEVNALGGHETADKAAICVTTQAALKMTLRGTSGEDFKAARRFHFRGCPRAVVAWDEAFAFNRPVVIDADSMAALARAMRRQSNEAADRLLQWAASLSGHPEGVVDVPDFESLGVDFARLEDDAGDGDALAAQSKALGIMSGARGFASRDFGAPTVITHFPELPRSILPVIVTDASADVKPTYRHMAQWVPLVRLKTAGKTYRNLTIRVIPAAASRSVYQDPKSDRGRELVDTAARYIRSVPEGADVLVVSYKAAMRIRGVREKTIREAIDARLSEADKVRTRHLSWGSHTATNAHRHVRHLLITGLYFLSRPTTHAATGAALDMDLLRDHPTRDQIEETRRGMLLDATLQAVLRGHARVGLDGDCGEMEVVIFQARQSGLREAEYRSLFPGARVVFDHTFLSSRPLKGRLEELAQIIARRLKAGETEIPHLSVRDEMRMAKGNFGKLLTRPEWKTHADAEGLVSCLLAGRRAGWRVSETP